MITITYVAGMSYKLQIQLSQAVILLVYLRNGKYNDHKQLYCWYILEMASTMITSGYVAGVFDTKQIQ